MWGIVKPFRRRGGGAEAISMSRIYCTTVYMLGDTLKVIQHRGGIHNLV